MSQSQVLIADDDDMTLEMLDAALQGTYKVTTTHRGQAALALARQQAFDLVLLDVDMPDMDGYATCQALKIESPELPVIFLSAKVNLDERLRGYQVGGDDYLTKPFDVSELTAKIEHAVGQRARHQALNSQVEDAMNTVLSTADMYGEVGLVLELQRQLADCNNYADLANAFFVSLERMGFDGCLRLCGRLGVLSRTARAECSALEQSILDHIEASKGPSIQPVGQDNTSYNYGSVLMLIRKLPQAPQPGQYSQDDIDRLARARDNIALMAEGLHSRMRSLDVETEKSSLENSQHLVQITRDTLVDIAAQQHANRLQLGAIFQRMNSEVEQSFIHLGLSEVQEEHLSSTLRRHISEAMHIFDQSNQVDDHMTRLITRLKTAH
jgi:CheY-like chemotaxis protein